MAPQASEYHPFSLHLTHKQICRIIEGHRVRIVAEQLAQEGGHPLHLTKVQINRILRHRAEGKGVDIQLSHLQLLHHAKHGSGMFGDLVRKAGNFVRDSNLLPVLRNTALDGAKSLASYGIDKLSDVISDVVPDSLKQYSDAGLAIGSKLGRDQIGHLLNGLKSSKNGSGLFPPGYSYGGGLFPPGYGHK